MNIAIDFDGTIVEHKYPAIGKPIPFAIDVIKLLQSELHHNIILWSVREGKLLDDAVNYCANRGLEFYAINRNHPDEDPSKSPRKLTADLFIDDRNLGGIPDWGVIYNMIKNGESMENAFNTYKMKPQKKSIFNFLKK